MADIYKGELQDNLGNTVYPHTESDVVFCSDGQTVQEKLTKTENVLGDANGKTDSIEVSDTNILATSKAINNLKTTLETNFQAGVDTLYDKCVALGSTPTDKTPSAIADAMDGISRYAEGEVDLTAYNVWHEVELGFKPKILSVYFYWKENGSEKLSIAINHSAYGGLDSRYVQLTDTGFKCLTNQAAVANTGCARYAAAG